MVMYIVDLELFQVGQEPQKLHNSMVCSLAATNDFRWLPKCEPSNAVVKAWWWIFLPIHIIWMLSLTMFMFEVHVRTNHVMWVCSLNHRSMVWLDAQKWWPRISADSQIWVIKCGGNGKAMDTSVLPQHMKVVKYLAYVRYACWNYSRSV